MAAFIATAGSKVAISAGKWLAKRAGKKALAKIKKGGKKKSGMRKTIEVILSIFLALMLLVGYVLASFLPWVQALFLQVEAMSPAACSAPQVSGVGNESSSGSDPAAEAPDGSGGSHIGFPSESTSKIVYPVSAGAASITSHVGMRQVPAGTADFYGTGMYYHNGTDFGVADGTPVYAMADGIVAQAGPTQIGYGNVITIHHVINDKRYSTTYGHMITGSLTVKTGDTVKAGQRIASVGSEGNSSGPHLHWVLTEGIYSANFSEFNKGPQNNIDGARFLASNGAVQTTDESVDGTPLPEGESAVTCISGSGGMTDGVTLPWGNYTNGRIPDSALQSLSWAPDFRLAKSAANHLEGMNGVFKKKFGRNLPVTAAYRSSDDPAGGTDVLGWAKVIEFDGSISFGSAEYEFLDDVASQYDYINPLVHREDGDAPKANRWIYYGKDEEGSEELPLKGLNDYQKYAGDRLQSRGMTDSSELSCLVQMWNKESNWNPKAANSSSDARGIPQMMMDVHFGKDYETNAAGREYLDNPQKQIDVGLDYIAGRYGTPCNAWSFWQENEYY